MALVDLVILDLLVAEDLLEPVDFRAFLETVTNITSVSLVPAYLVHHYMYIRCNMHTVYLEFVCIVFQFTLRLVCCILLHYI